MNKVISGPLCILQRSKMGTVPIPLFFSDLCYCEQCLSRDSRLQMKSATYQPSITTALNSLPLRQLAVPVLREVCGKTGRTDTSCQYALGPRFVLAADRLWHGPLALLALGWQQGIQTWGRELLKSVC